MTADPSAQSKPKHRGWLAAGLALALILIAVGIIGFRWSSPPASISVSNAPTQVTSLQPGTVATLNSPPFAYSPGWTVTSTGADPSEPADPWTQPSGVITFTYVGSDLFLQLAQGDYWGYLHTTVDGKPADYRTFYAPELQRQEGPTPQWLLVHQAADSDQVHEVRLEFWRGWGQSPIRAVAIDAQLPPASPRWPFVAALVFGIAILTVVTVIAVRDKVIVPSRIPGVLWIGNLLARVTQPMQAERPRKITALLGALIIALAIFLPLWWLAPIGLALLGYASLRQPALWASALLFALPFYFSQTLPFLPNRATNIIDVGVLGGILVATGAWFLSLRLSQDDLHRTAAQPPSSWPILAWILALAGWSLIAASAATYSDIALREWRTVFLAAALFALLLNSCRHDSSAPWLLILAWIAGGVAIALIGLGQFATDAMLIEAEGVHRVRSLYGSPNNLALYLERTLMPTLAFLLLLPNGRRRWLALIAAAVQGGVLLLTFSKGALILGLPAGLITLWLGGLYILRRQQASLRPLWWLAAAAGLALLTLVPFLGTERFQRLLDFDNGTGFTRLQLWRSSLQMALDHPWLGVGPDNFLYAYRSQYILPAAWQEPNLNHPHTWLLDWWVRLGLVGILLGIGWWLTALHAIWRRLRDAAGGARCNAALWLGTLAAMVAALAHGLIDLSYAVPDLMLVWVLLTMLPTFVVQEDPQ